MPLQPYPIANFKTGLDKSLAPWLIPDDAYTDIINAHIERGALVKRKGSTAIWRFPAFVQCGQFAISAISNSSTTTITASGHTFVNGQIVQLTVPSSQILNFTGANYYKTANVTSNGFDVLTLSNSQVDTTTDAPYSGNGQASGGLTIGAVALGATTTVTTLTPHTLQNGERVSLNAMSGAGELNNRVFEVSNVTATTFTLSFMESDVDSTSYTPYLSGGLVVTYRPTPILGFFEMIKSDGGEQLLVCSKNGVAYYDGAVDFLQPINFFNSFDVNELFQGQNFNNRLFFSTLSAGIQAYDPNNAYLTKLNAQYGPGSNDYITACSNIHHLEGRLILFSPTFLGSLAGQYRNRLIASAQVAPDRETVPFTNSGPYANLDFRIDVPGNAFYLDLDTDDQIISVQETKAALVIFCTRSIWRLRATPSATRPFVAERIHTLRACSSKNASVKFEESVASLGKEGLIATDGQNVQRLDAKIPQWIYDQLEPESYGKIVAGRDERFRQVWFLYPKDDYYIALVMQEDSLTFSLYQLNISTLGSFVDPRPEATWQRPTHSIDILDIDVTFADLDVTWDSFETQTNSPVMLGGNNQGEIFIMNRGSSDDGMPIAMRVTSKELNPGVAQGVQSQLSHMDICVSYDPTTELTVNFFANSDQTPDPHLIDTSTSNGANTMQRVWKRVFSGQIASFHKIQIEESSLDGRVQIEAVIPYIQATTGRMIF